MVESVKKWRWLTGIVAFLLACSPAAAGAQAEVDTLARDNSRFAFELYRRLTGVDGNLFLSPYSISTAMAMTYAGARGDTERQMAATLCFTLDQEKLHPAFAALEEQVNAAEKEGIRLSVAGALWPQAEYPLRAEYLALTGKYYGVTVTPVDYRGARETARLTINHWVETRTGEKIKDLLHPIDLSADTRLVLVNAIYFKGLWAEPFKAENTRNLPFHLTANETVEVPMMSRTVDCRYAKFPDLEILELPYAGDRLSMVVLLPGEVEGVRKIEAELTQKKLADWLGALSQQKVLVHLPKFKMTSRFGLGDTLLAMGMVDAFSDRADFSGIAGRPGWLSLSAVIHQALVEVNEEGTEAAAATGVVMRLTSAPVLTNFRADHPFVFLIRDRATDSILFAGRLADPRDVGKE